MDGSKNRFMLAAELVSSLPLSSSSFCTVALIGPHTGCTVVNAAAAPYCTHKKVIRRLPFTARRFTHTYKDTDTAGKQLT